MYHHLQQSHAFLKGRLFAARQPTILGEIIPSLLDSGLQFEVELVIERNDYTQCFEAFLPRSSEPVIQGLTLTTPGYQVRWCTKSFLQSVLASPPRKVVLTMLLSLSVAP